jgi:hypothetical protein
MSTAPDSPAGAGAVLAARLGLTIHSREGHDLAGACVGCQSSDAFRLHQDDGVAQCYSCGGKWSPFQLAEKVLASREQAKALLVELGIFKPQINGNGQSAGAPALPQDPVQLIAVQKGVTAEALLVFGAKAITPFTVRMPAYGPDGKQCTHFDLSVRGGKGKYCYGKPAGLFFPHEGGSIRLPQSGETWHLVEGCKDAAALHGLGLHACGLNTCRLAAKFARLFQGAAVVLIPDRDKAGEEGAQHSARVLRGVAESISVAVLPAEFKESGGEDVRDILRRPSGKDLVMQAIVDAQPVQKPDQASDDDEGDVSGEVQLPEGDPLTLTVSPTFGKPQRLVVAKRGEITHRDRINTDSSMSRNRLFKQLAAKLGIDLAVLAPLVDPQITALADQADEQAATRAAEGGDDEEQSQATMAVNMAAGWDLWHTPAKDAAYATVPIGDHYETWPVKSQTFKRYVAKCFYDEKGKAMNSDAMSAAINLMEAKALFEGEDHPVYVRVAPHQGNVYVDLGDADWRVIEITSIGWQIIKESPVKFRRSRGMLALPNPETGGRIDDLRQFLNVEDDTWALVAAWLIAAFCPHGPYPILALFAEQGSGKSTTGRRIRDLVDPNSAPLRAEPGDERDLMITANNSWCLAYDNLSNVPQWLSDALCRLSTGGGFATRELYTDSDEIIFDSQRPVMLTSIEDVATRSDLLDRCLIVWLPTIPKERRRPEDEMLAAFEKARPRILGAILDAVSGALRNLGSTRLDGYPRMADFARWVTAAEAALGWPKGTFMAAYAGNQDSANELALEASVIAKPLLEFLDVRCSWSGSASELIKAIEERVDDQVKRQHGWPKNPRALSGHLKRLSPNLRAAGWNVEYDRTSKKRLWSIERASLTSSSVEKPELMQSGAKPCELFPSDANDGSDVNDGTPGTPPERTTRNFEEGDL